MTDSRSLRELGDIIQSHSSSISDLLNEANIPQPSLSNLTTSPQPAYPKEVEDRRLEILEALDELRALIVGPEAYVFHTAMLAPSWTATFNVLYKYRVAHHVPKDGSISYTELSERCGLSESDITRVIRAAISLRLFIEDPVGFVKHSAASLAMANDLAHDAIGFAVEEYGPAALKFPEALERFPGSEKANESACAIVNGSVGDQDIFSLIANDTARVDRVANAMAWVLTVPETSIDHFLANVPWSYQKDGFQRKSPKVLVDVGGSHGGLCEALLREYPDIERAIVEDLPEVTRINLQRKQTEDVANRIRYQAYNFFTEQEVKGADFYVFRTVLHDWPDSDAAKILRNQIPALKPGARILINDICIDASRQNPSSRTQTQSAMDLMVKMALNAKERTRQQWEKLLADADKGFKIESIVSPSHSVHSVIEISWEDR